MTDTRELQRGYDACRRVTRAQARNFYYAFALLPARKRRAIFALYTFARHADDIVDDEDAPTSDRRRKLDAFRNALDQALAGSPAEPWWAAFADAVERHRIPREHADGLLDGCQQDLIVTRYATLDDTLAYCHRVAALPGLMCLRVFGVRDGHLAAAESHGAALGYGMQLTNILRDVREDAGRDRVYVPADLLDRHGVTEAELMALTPSDRLAGALLELADLARDEFAKGRQLAPLIERDARFCPAVLADLYGAILARIRARPLRVLEGRLALGSARKLAIALKAFLVTRLGPTGRLPAEPIDSNTNPTAHRTPAGAIEPASRP